MVDDASLRVFIVGLAKWVIDQAWFTNLEINGLQNLEESLPEKAGIFAQNLVKHVFGAESNGSPDHAKDPARANDLARIVALVVCDYENDGLAVLQEVNSLMVSREEYEEYSKALGKYIEEFRKKTSASPTDSKQSSQRLFNPDTGKRY